MLRWMQKQGLLRRRNSKQIEDFNHVNSDGNDVSNTDDYNNNNSNNYTDEEIEHVNYHSKWLNNIRHSCLLTIKALMMTEGQEGDESRPNGDKIIQSQQEQEEEGDWSETLEGAFMFTFIYCLCISSY